MFLFAGMALMGLGSVFRPLTSPRASSAAIQSNAVSRPVSAPWGELEYSRFGLRQPDMYLPDGTNQLPSPAWYFEGTTPERVRELLNSLESPPLVRQLLFDTNRWSIEGDTVVVNPTLDMLLGLGRPARERIYSILGRSPMNMPQYYPFRFRADGFDEWFAQSQLAPEKLELVRSLTYTNRGGAVCLADMDVLQQKLGPDGFRSLCESLYTEHSLFLSLRVNPSTNVKALASYWGRGGREQEVLAILKSVASVPSGGSVNIAYLLPQFARLRLYTFAAATNDFVAAGQDCFWTALNFFKREHEVQLAGNSSLEALAREHSEVRDAPGLGDVVLFVENRKPVHACVYIADDVVFTKNGVNYHQPWVLMKMSDLLPRYATDRPMSVVVLRSKHI